MNNFRYAHMVNPIQCNQYISIHQYLIPSEINSFVDDDLSWWGSDIYLSISLVFQPDQSTDNILSHEPVTMNWAHTIVNGLHCTNHIIKLILQTCNILRD